MVYFLIILMVALLVGAIVWYVRQPPRAQVSLELDRQLLQQMDNRVASLLAATSAAQTQQQRYIPTIPTGGYSVPFDWGQVAGFVRGLFDVTPNRAAPTASYDYSSNPYAGRGGEA